MRSNGISKDKGKVRATTVARSRARIIQEILERGLESSDPCDFCKRNNHKCISMEGHRCLVCTRQNRSRCNAVPLERISEIRDRKMKELQEATERFDEAQAEVQKLQGDLTKALEKFSMISAEVSRRQKEMQVIIGKHRESLFHAEALLLEEDMAMSAEEVVEENIIEEPVNYFLGGSDDFGRVTAYNLGVLGLPVMFEEEPLEGLFNMAGV